MARGPDDAHYLAVTFLPEFETDELATHRASETMFLLDCSGSMQGESISPCSIRAGIVSAQPVAG